MKINKNTTIGNICFSREFFIETMEAIEQQHEHDKKCGDAFKIILPEDFVSYYDNHWIMNQLIKLMKIAMNDNHRDSWIEYYIWDLDFGKNYQKGCASNKDGSPIDLSNVGALYDFLKT